jgi:hypothetical protein
MAVTPHNSTHLDGIHSRPLYRNWSPARVAGFRPHEQVHAWHHWHAIGGMRQLANNLTQPFNFICRLLAYRFVGIVWAVDLTQCSNVGRTTALHGSRVRRRF